MVHGAVLQNMVMKCNKIRFHTCEGESFVLTKPHVCLFSSLMLLLWVGRKARGDFKEVGTSNMSHSTHTIEVMLLSRAVLTLPMCVSALAQLLGISGQYFNKYRYKPEPIASLNQGWALVGCRASSPAQHITNHNSVLISWMCKIVKIRI